jgi:uncharacterized membrane protein YhaH (DUF805 family)/type II secretory pathway pseudopilin PulG
MDEHQATDIKFFDASSRIGRLRYLAYGMGVVVLLLPALIIAGILTGIKLFVLSWLILAACYIFMLTMSIVFGIRRLHDLGRTGWWMLIIPIAAVFSLLNLFHQLSGSLIWVSGLLSLIVFVFYLILLFARGNQGENHFGPPPPPNSGWVVLGAWSFLIVPFGGGIVAAIAIPAYQDYTARSQTAEAIQLAGGAEQSVASYHDQNKVWPTDLSPLYPKNPDGGIGVYSAGITAVTEGDRGFGIMVNLKQTGVVLPLAGKRVEIWTTDGGKTWQCGPASLDPVDIKFLPASCRSDGAL